jgi:hypothetical protein
LTKRTTMTDRKMVKCQVRRINWRLYSKKGLTTWFTHFLFPTFYSAIVLLNAVYLSHTLSDNKKGSITLSKDYFLGCGWGSWKIHYVNLITITAIIISGLYGKITWCVLVEILYLTEVYLITD